ncbi:hypothetical protein D9M68_817230 [compost metagenome]
MQGQGRLDHCRFMRYAHRVQASARPDQLGRRAVQQPAGHGRRGGGIADTHLAADKQFGAGLLRTLHAIASGLQGDHRLRAGHRRLAQEVLRAGTDLQMPHAG